MRNMNIEPFGEVFDLNASGEVADRLIAKIERRGPLEDARTTLLLVQLRSTEPEME